MQCGTQLEDGSLLLWFDGGSSGSGGSGGLMVGVVI